MPSSPNSLAPVTVMPQAKPGWRKLIFELPLLLGINLVIGLFLTALNFGGGLAINLVTSQFIGCGIYVCVTVTYLILAECSLTVQLVAIGAAIGVGAALGFVTSTLLTGLSLPLLYHDQSGFILQILLISLLFGTTGSYYFISKQRLVEAQALAQDEKIKRLAQEKQAVTMQLKMLQAQIEPHFLFNTLSNLESLLDSDVATARRMLHDLTSYLRTTLTRSRGEKGTLAQEMEIIRAYLAIQQIRMGARLRFSIALPEELAGKSCPPLLIQPLVENAVRHGLEPSIPGGEVSVTCRADNGKICIEVQDTGVGIAEDSRPGTGTSNVRERLQALFGAAARLSLKEVVPSGVMVMVEYPEEPDAGPDC